MRTLRGHQMGPIISCSTRTGQAHVWLSTADGEHQVRMTSGKGSYSNPDWSSPTNGKTIDSPMVNAKNGINNPMKYAVLQNIQRNGASYHSRRK